MKLSIVIPCYNEEKNIPFLLKKFSEIISNEDLEVVLVNNGSTDNSQKVLEELIPNYSFARTVLVPVNKGYGYGILQGLKETKGTFVGWTHADMQTDLGDIIKAYGILEKENWDEKIYVKGRRRKRTFTENFFTIGLSIFESIYLGTFLWDIVGQHNIFCRKFYETWQNPPSHFELDTYSLCLAKRRKMKIIRFNVLFPKRKQGESSWNAKGLIPKLKEVKKTLKASVELKRKGLK